MKKLLIILSFMAVFFPKPILAESGINKFGIHVLEPSDLPKAQELVNSSGGDWGWVTVVIRDDDMNFNKWQGFMDECRVRHLIPLVRIATHLEGENWAKPKLSDTQNWANFLNELNWPVSDQYVIIFNEPNHAKEWGGEINPQEYSRILSDLNEKLKIKNEKFNVLNAGLDLAAANSKTTMDAYLFVQKMNEEVPGIFEKLDGWASHSYPNYGFLGKPWDTDRHSIQGYKWELFILKNDFGLKKELPVFITETGWPHQISNIKYQISKTGKKIYIKQKYYDEKTVAIYIKHAYENVWLKDERIMAVTPFVLNYPEDLFADFSWFDKESNPYKQYEDIKNLKKMNWQPKQEFKAEVLSITLPPFLPVNTEFNGSITLKNLGQSIWGEYGNIVAEKLFTAGLDFSETKLAEGKKVKPGEKIKLDISVRSSTKSGEMSLGWKGIGEYKIKVFPASTLTSLRYNFWQKVILKIREIIKL